jgi:hypothetical protein
MQGEQAREDSLKLDQDGLDESDLRTQIDCSEPILEAPFPSKICGSGFSLKKTNLSYPA